MTRIAQLLENSLHGEFFCFIREAIRDPKSFVIFNARDDRRLRQFDAVDVDKT